MTIRKGEPWGAPAPLPPDGVVVRSDAEAREVVTAARRANEPVPALGLLAGDLCRTVSGPGDEARLRSDAAMSFPCDLGEVLLDGRLHFFVAHLVARRRAWLGRTFVAMNADWLGELNLAPKGHPNDGLLDISEGSLPLGQLLAARRRARLGAHLPHPRIEHRRTAARQVRFERPVPVRLDGTLVGEFRDISVRVASDALTIVI
jgi:hypothetical protein